MRVRDTGYRDTTRKILQMLAVIGTHAGITSAELMDELGVSRATVKRLIRHAREEFLVDIQWRPFGTDAGGEYTILDWGVLDRNRVLALLRPRP